jgi:hypothetical protein
MSVRGMTAVLKVAAPLVAAVVAVAIASSAGAAPTGPGGDQCLEDTSGSMTMSQASVVLGQSATLQWEATAPCPVTAKLVGPDGSTSTVGLSGSRTITPTTLGTSTWTLRVTHLITSTNAAIATIQATAPPPPPQPPVVIIRPDYDPFSCQHMVMCKLTDVSGDGVEDAVGFVDHSDFNFGWQGRVLVREGSRVVNAGDTTVTFAPWTLWGGTSCDTPGEDCQFADINGDHVSDVVEFVRSSVTGSTVNPINGATEGDVLTYWADPVAHRFGDRIILSDSFCTGTMTCKFADMNGDRHADAVAFVKSTIGGAQEGDVWVALSNMVSFPPISARLFDAQKWSDRICVQAETCALGDVNGDGRADAVAFARASGGTAWVALSGPAADPLTGSLLAASVWATGVCVQNEICGLVDVDKDHHADAVARDVTDATLHGDQAWVALSNGTAFGARQVRDLTPAQAAHQATGQNAGPVAEEDDGGGPYDDVTCEDRLYAYSVARQNSEVLSDLWKIASFLNAESEEETFEALVDSRAEESRRRNELCPI